MATIVIGILCLIAGFVCGMLVFRNNQAKFNVVEAEAEVAARRVKDTVEEAVDAVGKAAGVEVTEEDKTE